MDLKAIRVLIVDDDDADRKLIRRLLSRLGITEFVSEQSRAQEALNNSVSEYDAVFIDHHLSGATGLSFLSELRRRWQRAAIFLTTGCGDETVAKTAIQEGATDYLSKSNLTASTLRSSLVEGMISAEKSWRLEQQRVELQTFSEVLVHDFKAPIRAASYLTDQIEEDLDAGEIGEVQNGLRLLKQSAEQMREMIRSLSDHIRHDRATAFSEHDAADLVEGARTRLALELSDAAALLNVEVDTDLPKIVCDGPQISQVLQNLIANAVKYSDSDQPKVTVKTLCDGSRVLFEVADEGRGIPAEHIESIFLPFKRVPGSSSISGTGLGLATCRKIVSRHDGRIWCKSDVGKGTTMYFSFPVSQPSIAGLPTLVANTADSQEDGRKLLGI